MNGSATVISFAEAAPGEAPRRPLRLIACGSVDDGKSTLIGRLLWDTKSVKEDQAATLAGASGPRQNELGLPDFALLLDGLQAEREQGITIDVAYRYFSTDRRSFIVADTPGHEQYTRNMATGASTAELAVLLVDARSGLIEQTRRHATIAALMGIGSFVLAVNKMDLALYEESRFRSIERDFRELASSLGIDDAIAIPLSALKGENVARPAGAVMGWYEGPTLVGALEQSRPSAGCTTAFRMSVQRVCRTGAFRGYQGTIAGGSLRPGDAVVVLPSGVRVVVESVATADGRVIGRTGDAVTLTLADDADIARGDMLSAPEAPPAVGNAFDARVVVLQPGGMDPGKRYWLKAGSRLQRVAVTPGKVFDLRRGGWSANPVLDMNAIGEVRLRFEEPAIFDPYAANRATGSFILIDPDTDNTIAGGMTLGPAAERREHAFPVDGGAAPIDRLTRSGDRLPAMTAPATPTLLVQRLPHAEGLALPAYESTGAAGMDLRAAVPDDRPLVIPPGRRALVPTGFVLAIPAGFEGQVRPRSGLALRNGITCLNTPGTIDADYRGEVKVLLVNLSDEDFSVERGMRIAQLVVAPVTRATISEAGTLDATGRGAGGFGSTGTG